MKAVIQLLMLLISLRWLLNNKFESCIVFFITFLKRVCWSSLILLDEPTSTRNRLSFLDGFLGVHRSSSVPEVKIWCHLLRSVTIENLIVRLVDLLLFHLLHNIQIISLGLFGNYEVYAIAIINIASIYEYRFFGR